MNEAYKVEYIKNEILKNWFKGKRKKKFKMKNLLQILLSMFELFFIYLHTYNFSRLKYILIFFFQI
jgi:hypothetical protein